MNKNRILIIILVVLLSLGLVSVTMAATSRAGEPPTAEDSFDAYTPAEEKIEGKIDPDFIAPQPGRTVRIGANPEAIIFAEDFESWPPPGWTIVNNGGTCVWDSNTFWGRSNYAGGDGQCADADSDACGPGTTMDTELQSPLIDLSSAPTGTSLRFVGAYNDIGTGDYAEVLISPDGGTTWFQEMYWNEDHSAYGPGEVVVIDMTPYVGSNQVIISFHYFADDWDWWFEVDQVRVQSPSPDFGTSYKEAWPPKVEWLEPLTYTIVIRNTGDAPALNTVMTDVIPAGTEFISGTLSCSSGNCWFDDLDNTVYWTGTVGSPAPPLVGWKPDLPEGILYDPLMAYEDISAVVDGPGPLAGPLSPFNWPTAVLWDNGPLVTHPGGGAGGADASALQTALGMGTYGYGHQYLLGYRIADDFEVTDPFGWNVDQITFFAYQTNAPTDPSTITGVYYQIWDGPPDDPASNVVFGDTTTNRLINTVWSNIYRVLDTNLLATNRPIMADTTSAGVTLPPGTYWLDWNTDGSLSSGPWAPPITILGQTTTGNGLQSLDGGATWAPVADVGPQGFPFIIEGQSAVPSTIITFQVAMTGVPCGEMIHNEAVIYDPEAGDPMVVASDTAVVGPLYDMEDFEADDGGYTSVGVNPWTWGPPPMGPAHSGVNAWSTESPYVPNADYQLLSALIDLPADPIGLSLEWWQDIFIESATWDQAYVEITTDTVTYEILWEHTGGTYDSGGWEDRMADISGYAGEVVQLRFRMETDSSVQYDGWAIDDVAIRGACGVPIIDVDPDVLENVQYPDQVILQTLDVSNLGDNLLLWNFFETPPLLGPEALSFYYDRAVFDGDWPGLPIEGFENTLVPDFSVLACDGPFNSATNNACFAPGGILDGISLMNVITVNQMVVLGDGFLGPHTAIVGPNTFVDHHDISFDPPVYAVGFDVIEPFAPGDSIDIYVYGPGDILLGQDTFIVGDYPPSFWGVASAPEPITRIRTESVAGNGELFDDIAFGGMLVECGVDWATPSPDAGMNMPGITTTVEVGFDSTGLALGVYTGTLCIKSNDPTTPFTTLPVTLTVVPLGVELEPPSVAMMGDPGTMVTYALTLTNTGGLEETFDLTKAGETWEVHLPVTQTTLAAGASTEVIVHVTIPADAMGDESDMVTITAASQTDGAVSDSSDLTTTANIVYGLELTPATDAMSGEVDSMVTYTLTLTNTGNTMDTFDLTKAGETWEVHLPVTQTTLAAGASTEVIVHVTIPADAADGDSDTVTITATSQGDPAESASAELTTTAVISASYIYLPIVIRQ